jgi:hypothetical protein
MFYLRNDNSTGPADDAWPFVAVPVTCVMAF